MANANEQGQTSRFTPVSSPRETCGSGPEGFWVKASDELFHNLWDLHQQIKAYFSMKSLGEGFPEILVFCVYMCGSLSSFLWRYPALCPLLGERAERMAQHSLEVLSDLHAAWPTSSKWQKGLQEIATPLAGVSPTQEQEGNTLAHSAGGRGMTLDAANFQTVDFDEASNTYQAPWRIEHAPIAPEGMLGGTC